MTRLVVYYTPTTYEKEIMGTEEEVAITSLLSGVYCKKKCTVFITNNTNSRFFFQFQNGANCVSVVLDL